jgi:hypothetical protein
MYLATSCDYKSENSAQVGITIEKHPNKVIVSLLLKVGYIVLLLVRLSNE